VGLSGTLENQGLQNMGIFCKIAVWGRPTNLSNFFDKKMGHFFTASWVGSEFDKKNGTPHPSELVDFLSLSHIVVKLSQLSIYQYLHLQSSPRRYLSAYLYINKEYW